jgi:hypothetical protein
MEVGVEDIGGLAWRKMSEIGMGESGKSMPWGVTMRVGRWLGMGGCVGDV